MSELANLKRRGAVAMAICLVAFAAAVGGFVFYFQSGQGWARIAAVAALIIGFGAQTWFIASLRRPNKGA